MSRFKVPALSQLKLADLWGQGIGDGLCGPLALYAWLGVKARGSEVLRFQTFLKEFYPEIRFGPSDRFTKMTFEEALVRAKLRGCKILDLQRRRGEKNLIGGIHRKLQSRVRKRPVLIQVGVHSASLKRGANHWSRGLGHFMVLLSIGRLESALDPLFTIEYWDPWDGKIHTGVLYEEVYRDFKAASGAGFGGSRKSPLRRSPSGHPVASPYLCLLAPGLDLYDPRVYFAQRSVYLLERALA